MLDNKIYVSIDSVLKEEGYKAGSPNGNDPNRVVYENEQSGKETESEGSFLGQVTPPAKLFFIYFRLFFGRFRLRLN